MRKLGVGIAVAATLVAFVGAPSVARPTASSPLDSPFYSYTGSKPLAKVPAGTVLKSRTVAYSIQGLSLPLKATQLLFRTRNARGKAVVGVTTVVQPLAPRSKAAKVVSYQSFYDSLNPEDEPSSAIAGGKGAGKGIANVELALFAPLLLAGYTINIPDTQGQTADFAAGPEYGVVTLDSLRAVSRFAPLRVGSKAPIGMIGYSGGAIGTEWAAELAPAYAPAIAKRIVGSAFGGVLVAPFHNLLYANGSTGWAGVVVMAIIGLSRAYGVSLDPYLSPYGRALSKKLAKAAIGNVLFQYPGVTFKKLVKPQYANPRSIKPLVRIANRIVMGTHGTPTTPLFIGQGTGGTAEGTRGNKPGIGPGDGVMIAGDVRSLARKYCGKGLKVRYRQYPLSHVGSAATWLPEALTWLENRFKGRPAPSSCGKIRPGNSLAPTRGLKPAAG